MGIPIEVRDRINYHFEALKKSNEENRMKPSFHNCGTGGNIRCPHWDETRGCLCNCKYFDDDNCEAVLSRDDYNDDEHPENEEYQPTEDEIYMMGE